MRDNIDDLNDAASVTLLAIGYRARCTVQGCRNLARTILRYADRGGRPLVNLERCNAHTRAALERDIEAGFTVYDSRDPRRQKQKAPKGTGSLRGLLDQAGAMVVF